jgi:CelD/BcsL family acetyltransferase involved in cellulose biosynthesis
MLPWWRRAAPDDALLRAAVVRDGRELVGIAPFFVDRWRGLARFRLLAAGTSARREPLAHSGREREVAAALARAVDSSDPSPALLVLEEIDERSPWPALLADAWGRGTRAATMTHAVAPTVALAGTAYDDWFRSRSANFRQQMRRRRRHLDDSGATFRVREGADLRAEDVGAFAALHRARWSRRGGSAVLDDRVEAMLAEAATGLPASRLRISAIEVDGRPISSQLFVAAGGEVAYWLGGFDASWSLFDPALQAILAAIENAFAVGDERVDLGPGEHDYKYRFADGEDALQSVVIIPPGPRSSRARAALALTKATRMAVARVPARPRRALKRILGR